MAELEAQVGELHPRLLDRDRPLWKFHVFEGLAPGPNRRSASALYTQVHHAAVDGQAAVALANAIFDLSPEPRDDRSVEQAGRRRCPLGMAEMLSGALANQLQQYANIVEGVAVDGRHAGAGGKARCDRRGE